MPARRGDSLQGKPVREFNADAVRRGRSDLRGIERSFMHQPAHGVAHRAVGKPHHFGQPFEIDRNRGRLLA